MAPLIRVLRRFTHRLVVLPLMRRWFGLRVTGHRHLPERGPAILVANHNSHLDTVALFAAVPAHLLPAVRPVAAADYFLRGPVTRWFFTRFVRIVAVDRCATTPDPLQPMVEALDEGAVLMLYPEGTRGTPGDLMRFHSGIGRLAALRPFVPIIPIHLDGCDVALPKGARRPKRVPIRATIGPAVDRRPNEGVEGFCERLRTTIMHLGRRSADQRRAA